MVSDSHTPAVLEFRLPDLGEGLADAELVSWRVAVGDIIARNDPIADVETAKAQVELPSPYAGRVTELLAQAGETIAVGTPIIHITSTDAAAGEPSGTDNSAAVAQRQQVLVGYGPGDTPPTRRRRSGPAPQSPPASARPDATPAARKLARELGVDLARISGTGANDAITTDDVTKASETTDPVDAPVETRVKVTGIRKRTAAAMVAGAAIPSVTEFLTVDVTESMTLLERLRTLPAFAGVKVTPLCLAAKIVLAALAEFPDLNAMWDDTHDEIVGRRDINLGIAVATGRGLIVPSIKSAQRLSLPALSREIERSAAAARDATATPGELTGGTFTITNIGVFGVDAGTPIINPGEAAILALGAITKRPWVISDDTGEDIIVPRRVITLALSFDHRIIDGEQGSHFLTAVGTMLENPVALLARL